VVERGGSGPDENEPTKYQAWRAPAFPVDYSLGNTVTVTLRSAMKDFAPNSQGSMTIYLRDFDGISSYTTIGASSITSADWLDGSTSWRTVTATLGISDHVIAAGHTIELKIIVNSQSADHLWFAYDTAEHPSRLDFPAGVVVGG
jgi:hypothetical protein